ncbi:MAG TPA: hypothetical protein VD995_30435 [Azospirillum sp.]|nr:hypothetical protein [Azospirillum sp.]
MVWRYARLARQLCLALLLAGAVAGCETYDSSNWLNGRWTLLAPVGEGLSLGTYEFRRSSMRALGLEQEVEYVVDGDAVRVIPHGFGPTLTVRFVDRNTASFRDPITGASMTLRRLHSGGGWFS